MNRISARFVACSREEMDPKFETPEEIVLPRRGTPHSAGYDFYCPYDVLVPAHGTVFVPTWVKCLDMPQDKVLKVFIRSSLGIKKGLCLSNGTGIIDSDYVWCIGISLYNRTEKDVSIARGERFAQGIFEDYYTIDGDSPLESQREGGFGSTGKK